MDIIGILMAIIGALSGLFTGYYFMPTNSHLREQNKLLKAKVASLSAELEQYSEAPELEPEKAKEILQSGDIDSILESFNLPSWTKPFIKGAIEKIKENPELLNQILGRLQPPKEKKQENKPKGFWTV